MKAGTGESGFAAAIKAGRRPDDAVIQGWQEIAAHHEGRYSDLNERAATAYAVYRPQMAEALVGESGKAQLDAHDENVAHWVRDGGKHEVRGRAALRILAALQGLQIELDRDAEIGEREYNAALESGDAVRAQQILDDYLAAAEGYVDSAETDIRAAAGSTQALDTPVDGSGGDSGVSNDEKLNGVEARPESDPATTEASTGESGTPEEKLSEVLPEGPGTNVSEPTPADPYEKQNAVPEEGIGAVPTQPVAPVTPMPTMPASPLGSGAGAGGGGVSSGLGSLGSSSGGLSSALKPATSIPASGAGTSPASAMPSAPPDSFASGLSNAGSSFQSGVASGMGASGAVSPVSQFPQPLGTQQPVVAAPVSGLGAQGVSGAAVPDGPVGGGPAGHGTASGAPGGAPVGGGGVMPPPMAGGQPLAPYSPPGAGAGGGVPATPTAPAGGGPTQSSSGAAPAGTPAMVAGSGGSSVASSAVAASTTDVNPDLWTAQRVLADLVRGTDRSGDVQVVWWGVSVLRTADGPSTVIASSVGGGGYVPPAVYLPLTSRLAVYDSSLPMGWGEDWMGWQSPVAILAAHHERVAETLAGVRVSAIATSEVWPRRPDCGGDFVAVQHKDILQMPGQAPILDGAHQHRLKVIDPALAQRVAALDRGGDVTAWVGAQLTAAVIRAAMEPDETGKKLATPQDAEILEAVNSGRATADRWEAYEQEVAQREGGAVALPEIHAPRDRDSSPASVDARLWYRHYYRMGRIVELVRCWRSLPVSLADVAYCGQAAGYGSVVAAMIAAIEQHLKNPHGASR